MTIEECLAVVRDPRAQTEQKNEAYETIIALAKADHDFLYIERMEAGKKWFRLGVDEQLYAFIDPYFAILFVAPSKQKRSGVLADVEEGRLVLWEEHPGALREFYQGQKSILYSVPAALFQKEAICPGVEKVSIVDVPVVQEEQIEDAYAILTDAVREGKCVVHEYEEGERYKSELRSAVRNIRRWAEAPILIIDDGTLVKFCCDADVEELVIPDGVSRIGWHAFYETIVRKVVLPASVTVIEEEAFYECSLNQIVIPEGVKIIEEWAFGACYFLREVIIPDSVTSIGRWAFGCRRNYLYYDPEPIDQSRRDPQVILIGRKGSEAQRYAERYNSFENSYNLVAFRERE